MEHPDLSQLTKAQIIERLLFEGVACSEKELKDDLLDKLKAVIANKEEPTPVKPPVEPPVTDSGLTGSPEEPAPPEVLRNVFKLLTKEEQDAFCTEVFPGFMPVIENGNNKDPYVFVSRFELFRLFQSLVSNKTTNITGESAVKLLGRLFNIPTSNYRAAKDFWVSHVRSFGRGVGNEN